jgi:hypothetical protein
MSMGRKVAIATTSLKGAGLITLVDLGLAGLARAGMGMDFLAALGLVLLLESAVLMLIGGALSFSGQESVRRLVALVSRTQTKVTKADLLDLDSKAAAYALVGVLLFVESLTLAAATL